ncbi:MAG TPA: SusC/RagA family TonB-linked outer membrane protein [Longimicrobiales bacterium]
MISRFVRTAGLLLALAVCASSAWAQQRQVTGRVMSATGEALPGASVLVEGTALGTQANADGRFAIMVPSGQVVLVVQNIGYRTQRVVVAPGESSVDVRLEVDVLALDEIVVTGQATSVSRRNLANAVATVNAAELERVPSETIEKMVQGKVAGALIETNSGAPGGGVQVRLRGVSTINAESEPLYVVDGVIISNVAIASNANAITSASGGSNASNQDAPVNRVVDINPNDIESIEILKGASAAALYGSRAANGVIIITTKRGRPGEMRVDVTQRVGMFTLSNKLGSRKFETVDEVYAAFLDPEEATAADSAFFENLYGDGTSYDYEEMLAGRNDVSTETAFSLRGGSDATRYFVSGLVKNDEGIIPNTGFQKQSIRLNLDQRVGDRVELGVNANVIHTFAERGLTNNDNSGTSFYMVLPFTPNFVDLRPGPDGTYPENPLERSNPLQTAALLDNDEDVWRLISGANATFDAIRTERHSLRFRVTGGVDYFAQENEIFSPPELEFEDDDGEPGTSLLSNSDNLDLTFQATAVHAYTPASGAFQATTSAGLQYEDRDLNIARIVARNLVAGQRNVDAGTNRIVFETRERVKDLGLFVQEELLALDDRLLLTAGLRADRSSANGDTEKYFLFPKAAASYRFDELPGILDAVKLRTAWGQSGNQPLFGQKFTALDATNNIEGLPGLVVTGVAGDPNIEPERVTEIEGGVDIELFGGRASLEVTGFQKTIDNLLLQRTLAPSTGFGLQVFNGGEMRVRGLELGLQAVPVQNEDVMWVSRTTFYADRSEITDLPVPAFETGGFGTSLGAFRIEQGKSATQIVTNLGIDPETGEVIVGPVGDAVPDFRMGFVNDLTFGPFNLYTLVDWAHGHTVVNLTQFLADAGKNSADFDTDVRPITLPDGKVVQAGTGERRLIRWSDFADSRPYMEDGSYVKVREVSLSYALPDGFLDRVFGGALRSARITASGRNLLTFTGYSGLDPEVSNFGNQPIARNIDVAPFPPSRSFWLSFDVSF